VKATYDTVQRLAHQITKGKLRGRRLSLSERIQQEQDWLVLLVVFMLIYLWSVLMVCVLHEGSTCTDILVLDDGKVCPAWSGSVATSV
jgi:hypothetical protein